MRRRFIGFEIHERGEQLGEVEPIGRPDAHFAVQVLFVLQAGSEPPGGLGGDAHPLRNGLVGREGCIGPPFVLHEVDHEHRLSVRQVVGLQVMIVL